MSRITPLREFSSEQNAHVTWDQLAELRKHLDSLWETLGIDISFTHHFFDRVNDPRNKKQITIGELQKLFAATYQKHGQNIALRVKPGSDHEFEAVLTDLTTKVNLPFVLKWDRKRRELVLVAKTVMRKNDFKTPDPRLTVAHYVPQEKQMKQKTYRDLVEWIGWNTPEVAPIATPQAVDDVDTGAWNVEQPAVLEKLNAYCHDIANHQFLNPYYPLNKLWQKLNIIGLNFDLRKIVLVGAQGVVETPLTQYGGRYGFLQPGSDAVTSDDGISNRIPGGLKLVVRWQNNNGTYSLDVKIEHAAHALGFGEEVVVEDELTETQQFTHKIWTGPTGVKKYASMLHKHYPNTKAGTEHVYVHTNHPAEHVADTMKNKLGLSGFNPYQFQTKQHDVKKK